MVVGFQNRFRLCELFGIPIYLDLSLGVLLLLFATGGGSLSDGILCALLLLVSITAHEFGHALTARKFSYGTRDITLSLLGGCATLMGMPRQARQEFLTAAAGPAVSFVLSFLGVAGIAAFASSGFIDAYLAVVSETLNAFYIPVAWGDGIYARPENFRIISFFLYFATMNGMLGFFNLLPGFPLDGGRIFRSAMRSFLSRPRATYVAMIVGRGVAVLIGLRGLFSIFNGGKWGLVSLLIAWMIWKEGYREYLLAKAEGDFREWSQDDFNARVSPPPYER